MWLEVIGLHTVALTAAVFLLHVNFRLWFKGFTGTGLTGFCNDGTYWYWRRRWTLEKLRWNPPTSLRPETVEFGLQAGDRNKAVSVKFRELLKSRNNKLQGQKFISIKFTVGVNSTENSTVLT